MSLELDIYLADTKKLARTIRIKFSFIADQVNSKIVSLYGSNAVSYELPETWKYYMNLAGLYHPLDSGMRVISWDTGESIDFTKENLEIHAKTKEVYAYGTIQYKELLAQYPEQEELILGILYPCDLNTAIDAENGTILAYPEDLVESNEYHLLAALEEWTKLYFSRHFNEAFMIHQDLYAPFMLGIFYLNITPVILNIRDEYSNTNEAHSFHIKQYLTSRGIDSGILRFLSKAQLLYFYRNINYIQRNPGTTVMLKELIEAIMTARNLPVSSYYMRHSDTDLLTNLVPEIIFKRRLEGSIGSVSEQSDISLDALLNNEASDAPGNPNYILETGEQILESFEHSSSNTVQTKVLESTMLVYGDVGQFSLENTLLMYWAYFAHTGLYNNILRVQNPKTGEYFSIGVLDALGVAIYLSGAMNGYVIDKVPAFIAEYVPIVPTPPLSDLLSVVDSNYMDTSIVSNARSIQPLYEAFTSTIDFAQKVEKYHEIILTQNNLKTLPDHIHGRAMCDSAISRMYQDVIVNIAPAGTDYDDFLSGLGIDFSEYEPYEYTLLYNSIIEEATGIDVDNDTSLKSMHKAMIRLLKYLSSYSIQILQDYSGSEVYDLRGDMVRLGWAAYKFKDLTKILIPTETVTNEHSRFHFKNEITIPNPAEFIDESSMMYDTGKIPVNIGLSSGTSKVNYAGKILLTQTTILNDSASSVL